MKTKNIKEQQNEKKKKEEKEIKHKKIKGTVKFTILAVVLIAIFCIAITPVTFQNDTYYTIKVGEHIAKSGIDGKDPFSWHENLGYTYPHWGYDLVTYFIYDIFGFTGIYVTTCILTIILGLSIYLVNTKLVKNQLFSFIITIGVMYIIRGYIAARAQLFTFILFILTIYLIEKFIETKKKRYALGLIIIPIIIANTHVAVFPFYFVLYLPYIAEYIISVLAETIIYRKLKMFILNIKISDATKKGQEELIEKLKKEKQTLETKIDKVKIKRTKELQNPYKIKLAKNQNVKWLIVIMLICSLTGFLTPLGTTPYTYLAKTMEGSTTQNINEHLPMTISQETEASCAIIIILSILIFTKTKIRLSDLFMICGLLFLMLNSRRQITMFAIIGSVILNRLIFQLYETYVKQKEKDLVNKLMNIVGIIAISIVMLVFSYYMGKDKLDDTYVDESTYPIKASEYILGHIDLGTARFYNEYNYGSYLLFRGIPVFIDSRADLYTPEFNGKKDDIFMDFINTSSIGNFYGDIFEKYGITHVITYQNSKVSMIIDKADSDKYTELYRDDYFVIYEINK